MNPSTKLVAPYDFGWTLRSAADADVVQTRLGDGRREILINHQPLTGVTTEMLEWWFQNFDGVANYRGRTLPAYHLWHPRDHVEVRFQRDAQGRVSQGGKINIEEVFGRDPRYAITAHAVIHRWDRRGVGFHLDILGHRFMELDHVFTDTPAGVDYRTRSRVGIGNGPLRWPMNTYVVPRRFSDELATTWIQHNVEEVGCLVDFLPELFETKAISR